MADRIVSGGTYNESLAELLKYRERHAKGRLQRLEEEAAKIPEAEADLERASAANGWVVEMANLGELEGFKDYVPQAPTSL